MFMGQFIPVFLMSFAFLLGAQDLITSPVEAQQCCSCGSSCPQYIPGDGMKCKCCYCGVSATIQSFSTSSPGHGKFKTDNLTDLPFYVPDPDMSKNLKDEWEKDPKRRFKFTLRAHVSGPNEFQCIGYDDPKLEDRTKDFEKSHKLRKEVEKLPTHDPEHPLDK